VCLSHNIISPPVYTHERSVRLIRRHTDCSTRILSIYHSFYYCTEHLLSILTPLHTYIYSSNGKHSYCFVNLAMIITMANVATDGPRGDDWYKYCLHFSIIHCFAG
jgi:hypothetical protein